MNDHEIRTMGNKLGWLEGTGYIEPGWSIARTSDSVLLCPTGGVQMNLSFHDAYLYTSGMLIGAQGREKARPQHFRVLVQPHFMAGQLND